MPKPKFSLLWLFGEITLVAIACACFRFFVMTPGHNPDDILPSFFLFFIALGGALGGLLNQHLLGFLAGLLMAASLWSSLLLALS